MKAILSHDPLTKKTVWFHGDDMTGDFVLQTQFETEPILDTNKSEYNNAPDRFGEWSRVASIPMPIFFDLKKKGIIDDPEAFKKWLNDSDNRFFRTRPGRV